MFHQSAVLLTLDLYLHQIPVKQITPANIIIRLEDRLQQNIGFTLWPIWRCSHI